MHLRPLRRTTLTLSLVTAISLGVALSSVSCSGTEPSSSTNATSSGVGGSAGAGGSGGVGGDIGFVDGGDPSFADFPKDPLIDTDLPSNVGSLFDSTPGASTGGPCLIEPTLDAMFPRNWTPVFLEWGAPPEMNVFEVRLEVNNQINPLIIYTSQKTYSVPAAIWAGLTEHSAGRDVKITLRGARIEGDAITVGPLVGATGSIHIAPVAAPGSVVYWTSNAGTSFQGFTIGDTTSKTVLTPTTAGPASSGGSTTCISCHTSSPDGKLLFYSRESAGGPQRAIDVRYITGGVPGPDVVSPSALALLGRDRQHVPVMSAAHYSANDAVALSVITNPAISGGRYEILWTDLHATDMNGWGILARNGDNRQVTSPTWRHDGTEIAYVSSPIGQDGVIANTDPNDATMDIYTIPYNNRMGGDAKPLPGASDPQWREFYPIYSPDDTWLAFNRTSQPVDSYDEASAELVLVPSAGGTATRLRANDPPTCTGLVSPGQTNSWARWAPKTETSDGLKYYWLVFSSKRRAAAAYRPQLYISAVVTKVEAGKEVLVADYPAVYVTAQDPAGNNHTPAWDFFEVEQIPK